MLRRRSGTTQKMQKLFFFSPSVHNKAKRGRERNKTRFAHLFLRLFFNVSVPEQDGRLTKLVYVTRGIKAVSTRDLEPFTWIVDLHAASQDSGEGRPRS